MAATRTQVYLTAEQRKELDVLADRDGKTLAQLVREAVDAYLDGHPGDVQSMLDRTFGIAPDFEVPPRSEWDRGYG